MEDLRSQAQRAGGQMLSHLGNHEWMNAIGQCAIGSQLTTFYPSSDKPRMFRRLEVRCQCGVRYHILKS
jgi:hypothetical protein